MVIGARPEQRRPVHRDRVRQICRHLGDRRVDLRESIREPRAERRRDLFQPFPPARRREGQIPQIRREEQDQDGTRRDLGAEPGVVDRLRLAACCFHSAVFAWHRLGGLPTYFVPARS